MVGAYLDSLAATIDADWVIQDGVIRFIPRRQPTAIPVFRIDASNGLVGIPKLRKTRKNTVGARSNDPEAGQIVTVVVVLLNPIVRPGNFVDLDSELVKGRYKITTVAMQADTHQPDPWVMELSLVRA
jgi:hypothetical protein